MVNGLNILFLLNLLSLGTSQQSQSISQRQRKEDLKNGSRCSFDCTNWSNETLKEAASCLLTAFQQFPHAVDITKGEIPNAALE